MLCAQGVSKAPSPPQPQLQTRRDTVRGQEVEQGMTPRLSPRIVVAIVAVAALAAAAAAYAYGNKPWGTDWWGGQHWQAQATGWGRHHCPWGYRQHGPWAGPAPAIHGDRIVVSSGYASRVEELLKANNVTASLLSNGYTVARIKPIIGGVVAADGSVELNASKAIVVLVKPGFAAGPTPKRIVVLVDLASGTVEVLSPPYYPYPG